jgi:hypothetical protein
MWDAGGCDHDVSTRDQCFVVRKVTVLCEGCGEPFEARARDVERGWGRFCQKSCSLRARSSPALLS